MDEPEYYVYNLPQQNVKEKSAPLWRRLVAFIIDLIAFNFLFYNSFIQGFSLTSGLRALSYEYLLLNPELISVLFGVLAASSVLFCFYLALTEYVFGFTIGQLVMGLWVEGEPGLWGFVFRNFLKSTFILLLPLDLLGFLVFKKRFIDKLLRVNVLYEKRMRLIKSFI